MYTSDDIRNLTFQKSVNGYRPGDVEEFLDELATQIDELVAKNRQLKEQIENGGIVSAPKQAESDIPGLSGESLQNLLINAQRMADSIVNDAKKKAADILAEAEQKRQDAERGTAAKLEQTQEKIKAIIAESDRRSNDLVSVAVSKSENMITAAHDSVARQQVMFDKLKIGVSNFKKELVALYKKQLEFIASIPDEVPSDPETIARAVEFVVDSAPSADAFVKSGKDSAQNAAQNDGGTDEKSSVDINRLEPEEKAEDIFANPETESAVKAFEENIKAETAERYEAPAVITPSNDGENEEADAAEETKSERKPVSVIPEGAGSTNRPERSERLKNSLKFFDEYDEDDDDEDDEPRGFFKRRKK